jgi:D-lyxose ketol-isomerase
VQLWYRGKIRKFQVNGMEVPIESGEIYTLWPGYTIKIPHHVWHSFDVSGGPVIVEESSSRNNDRKDNFFYHRFKVQRYPNIVEDVPLLKRKYLLCTEMPGTKRFSRLVEQYSDVCK